MTEVPKAFPGATIVCLASGPSLTQQDVDCCRGKAVVLAIKDAIRLAPRADVLYCADDRWWKHHGSSLPPQGTQLRFALHWQAEAFGALALGIGIDKGLSLDPSRLNTGHHSGFSAINLAVLLGAARIILLGYDMQPGARGQSHWFGEHDWQTRPNYTLFKASYPTLVDPLRELGVEVLNASRVTAIEAFPCVTLDEALQAVAA